MNGLILLLVSKVLAGGLGKPCPTTHYPVIPRAVLYTDWKTLSDATDIFVVIIALFDA